jgi:hypothetical protein
MVPAFNAADNVGIEIIFQGEFSKRNTAFDPEVSDPLPHHTFRFDVHLIVIG